MLTSLIMDSHLKYLLFYKNTPIILQPSCYGPKINVPQI